MMIPAMLRMVVVLPAPFGPDQPEDLARRHLEGEPLDGREVAIQLLQSLDFDHGHPRSRAETFPDCEVVT